MVAVASRGASRAFHHTPSTDSPRWGPASSKSRDWLSTPLFLVLATVHARPIETGDDPIGIAVGDGAVWTANFRDGTVTKIEP